MRDAVAALVGFLRADPACGMKEGHKEIYVARAPGRLDVMGGAAEAGGGMLCQWPIEAGAAVAVQRREDRKLVIARYEEGKPAESRDTISISLDDFYGSAALMPSEILQRMFSGEKHWAAHVAGAFPALARHKKFTRRTPGANIACYCNLPCNNDALGTSAALACATLFGLVAAHHLLLEPLEIAILAHRLEGQTAGAPGGYAEPMTSVFGKKNCLLEIKSQPHELVGYAPPPRGCVFAAVSTAEGTDGEEEAARRRMRISVGIAQAIVTRTYRDLGGRKDPSGGYLANVPVALYQRYFCKILPEAMGGEEFLRDFGAGGAEKVQVWPEETYRPHAAAEFQVQENLRSRLFFERLHAAQTAENTQTQANLPFDMGRIMLDSLAAQGELARSFGAGRAAMEADLWRELVMVPGRGVSGGLFGVRGIGAWPGGSAGGGVAVLLADTPEARAELERAAGDFQVRTGREAEVLIGSSSGAAETAAMRLEASELTPGASPAA